MLILDANQRNRPVPPLARWCLGAGITATIGANLAHGLGHGPIGALVSAWPAPALVGSFELLATLIRAEPRALDERSADAAVSQLAPPAEHDAPRAPGEPPTLEQTVRAWHKAGRSQRSIAQELKVDRRKVRRIIEQPHRCATSDGSTLMQGVLPFGPADAVNCGHYGKRHDLAYDALHRQTAVIAADPDL